MSSSAVLQFNSATSALAYNPNLAEQISPISADHILLITTPTTLNLDTLLSSWESVIIVVEHNVSTTIIDAAPPYPHKRTIHFILNKHAQLNYQYHHTTAAHSSSVTHNAQLAPCSTFNYSALFASKSIQSDHSICVTLDESAQAHIKGAYLACNAQQLRIRTTQKHVGKKSESSLLFKGIVTEQASAAFTGTIRIEQSAAYTNADQQNKNLLVGQAARAESIPLLEVLNNEVQCGHGSAVGQLDEHQLNYLMMRGIPKVEAKQLLLAAFIADFDLPYFNNLLTQFLGKI